MQKKKSKSYKTFAFSIAGCNELKNETEGVGIGLSTAHSLTKAIGGNLLVRTNTNRSPTIEVEFGIAVT